MESGTGKMLAFTLSVKGWFKLRGGCGAAGHLWQAKQNKTLKLNISGMFTSKHAYIHTCMHAFMYVYMYAHMCVLMYARICMYILT